MEKRNNINQIYHYTSLQALYEILASRSLRLTSLRSSNDKEDLYFDVDEFHKMLDALHERLKDEVHSNFLNEMFNSTNINKIRHSGENTVYATSFTHKIDSLYHWKMYSSDMAGVCLGIDTNTLNKHVEKVLGLAILPVVYDDNTFAAAEEKVALWLSKNIYHHICMDDMETYTEYLDKNGVEIAMVLQQLANAIKKKEYFAVEDEERLFYIPNSRLEAQIRASLKPSDINGENACASEPCFVKYGNALRDRFFCSPSCGIRQYITLQFSEAEFVKIIKTITLGPCCRQSEYEIKQFLNAIGANHVKVIKSDIKIR